MRSSKRLVCCRSLITFPNSPLSTTARSFKFCPKTLFSFLLNSELLLLLLLCAIFSFQPLLSTTFEFQCCTIQLFLESKELTLILLMLLFHLLVDFVVIQPGFLHFLVFL